MPRFGGVPVEEESPKAPRFGGSPVAAPELSPQPVAPQETGMLTGPAPEAFPGWDGDQQSIKPPRFKPATTAIPEGGPETGAVFGFEDQSRIGKQEEGLPGVAGAARSLSRGGASGLLRAGEMVGQTLEWFSPEGTTLENIGQNVAGHIKAFRETRPEMFGESKASQVAREESEWNPRGWFYGGGESVGMMAPGLAVGGLPGAIATGGLFWGGTAQEAYNEINEKQPELPESDKVLYANQKGLFEGGVETLQQLLPFSIAKAIPKKLKGQAIKKIVGNKGAVDLVKDYFKMIAGETGMEVFQEFAGGATDYQYDLRKNLPTVKELSAVIGPTIIATGILGTSAHIGTAGERSAVQAALADPSAPKQTRQEAVEKVHQAILAENAEGSTELANAWLNSTAKPLQDEKPITIQDDDFYRENGIAAPKEVILDSMLLAKSDEEVQEILGQATPEAREWIMSQIQGENLEEHLDTVEEAGGPVEDIRGMIERTTGVSKEPVSGPLNEQELSELETVFAPAIREETEKGLEEAFAPGTIEAQTQEKEDIAAREIEDIESAEFGQKVLAELQAKQTAGKKAAEEKQDAVSLSETKAKEKLNAETEAAAEKEYQQDLKATEEALLTIPAPDQKRMKAEAKSEVDANPVYEHMAKARSEGLDLKQIKNDYTKTSLKNIPGHQSMFTLNGRVSPDDFASRHGYESLDEMIETFKNTPAKTKAAKQALSGKVKEYGEADRQMAEAEPRFTGTPVSEEPVAAGKPASSPGTAAAGETDIDRRMVDEEGGRVDRRTIDEEGKRDERRKLLVNEDGEFRRQSDVSTDRLNELQEDEQGNLKKLDFKDPEVRTHVAAVLEDDVVPEFIDSKKARVMSAKRAQELLKLDPEMDAYYIEMDIANVGGGNDALGNSGFDVVFGKIGTVIANDLDSEGQGKYIADKFRHGGDELSAVVVGKNLTKESIEKALYSAALEIENIAEKTETIQGDKLSEIAHPKHMGDSRYKGVNIHFAVKQISDKVNVKDTIADADKLLELRKKGKEENDEYRNKIGEIRGIQYGTDQRDGEQVPEGQPEVRAEGPEVGKQEEVKTERRPELAEPSPPKEAPTEQRPAEPVKPAKKPKGPIGEKIAKRKAKEKKAATLPGVEEKADITEDVGKELVYNKRNWVKKGLDWSDIKDQDVALRVKQVTKAKVYPRPDYQAMIDSGMQPVIAHVVKQAYDSLSAKPQTSGVPSDEKLEQYIKSVNNFMDGVLSWATNKEEVLDWITKISRSAKVQAGVVSGKPTDIMDMMRKEPEAGKGLLESVFPGGWKEHREDLWIIGGNKTLQAIQPYTSEAVKALKDIEKGWPTPQESWAKRGFKVIPADNIRTDTYSGETSNGRKYTYVHVYQGTDRILSKSIDGAETKSDPEVAKFRDEIAAELKDKFLLVDKRNSLIDAFPDKEKAVEGAREHVKPGKKKKKISEKGISVVAARRIGPPVRKENEDISSQKLMDTFKFKGINFGNWMKGNSNAKERQLHINHAYDSFYDLANLLNVPPEAMSLNGLIGVAFGAQGKGGAAAHFVPGFNEINLTRESGAGSLGHEWAHALDHHFARQAELGRETDPFMSEFSSQYGRKLKDAKVRPEIVDNFRKIVAAMTKRDQTKQEIEAKEKLYYDRTERNVKNWLQSIKSNFLSRASVTGLTVQIDGKDVPFVDAVEKVVKKIEKGEYGDGFVTVRKARSSFEMDTILSPAVAELKDLYKQAFGRQFQIKDLKALQSNIDSLKYRRENKKQKSEHIPQTDTDYLKEARSLDKETGKKQGGRGYWSQNLEMFARAFDAYISDTLEGKEIKNTYLSHFGKMDETVPKDKEREAINKAFDELLAEIKYRKTDAGVELYDITSVPMLAARELKKAVIAIEESKTYDQAKEHLLRISSDVYEKGMDLKTFAGKMASTIGDSWQRFKDAASELWNYTRKLFADERGAIGDKEVSTSDILSAMRKQGLLGDNQQPPNVPSDFNADRSSEWLNKLDPKWKNRAESFIYHALDKDDPKRLVQNRYGEQPESTNYLEAERLRGKKTAAEVEEFEKKEVNPILEQLANNDLEIADLEEYAMAKHVPERNEQMRRINARRYLNTIASTLSGKAAEELNYKIGNAQAELDRKDRRDSYLDLLDSELKNIKKPDESITDQRRRVSAAKRYARLNDIKKEWNSRKDNFAGMSDQEAKKILDRWESDKRINAVEDARKMLAQVNDGRLDDLIEGGELTQAQAAAIRKTYKFYSPFHREGYVDGKPASGRSTGPIGKAIKGATGSQRKVVDILANSVANRQATISRKHKSLTGRKLYDLVKNNPDPENWWIEESPKSTSHDADGNVIFYPEQQEPPNGVKIKVDGEQYTIMVNHEDPTMMRMMQSIKDADVGMNAIIGGISKVTRVLAALNTSLSPEFIVSNFIRDIQTAGINVEDTEAKGAQKQIAKNIGPAVKGIFQAERGADDTKWQKTYKDFEKNGGKIGWMQSYDNVQDLAKQLGNEMKLYQDGHTTKKTIRALSDLLKASNTAIENGVRLSTYDYLVNTKGVSKSRAASVASNLTVDFTRRGASGQTINALYMFANAGIQGNIRMIKAASRSPKVRKMLGGIVATGFAMHFLALATGGDDDDGIAKMDKVDDSLKERNMIFLTKEGKQIKIPMPYGYNIFFALGDEIAKAVDHNMSGKPYDKTKGMARLVTAVGNTFNPLASATLLQTIMPTIADPVAMVGENKTWFGGDLMPEPSPYAKVKKPRSQRFWRSATPASKFIAEELNSLTGGDKVKPGMLDVSPETLDLIWDTYTGSTGRFVTDTLQLPFRAKAGDLPARKIPFVRRVYGEPFEGTTSSLYRDRLTEVLTLEAQVKASEGDKRKELKKDKMFRLIESAKLVDRDIKSYSKMRKNREAKGLDVERQNNKIEKLQSKFIKKYEEAMKKK